MPFKDWLKKNFTPGTPAQPPASIEVSTEWIVPRMTPTAPSTPQPTPEQPVLHEPAPEQSNITLFQKGETDLGINPGSTSYIDELTTIPTVDRYAGMYVIGVQGVGKSSYLENLIYQEIINDQAVIVIDPHGDLIDHCIAQMPQKRLADTYVLDIEDTGYPFGLNLFSIEPGASDIAQAQAQDRLLHVFEKCFPETSRMLLEKYLGNIAPVFFANAKTGHAMTDIPKFLRDDSFRARLMRNPKIRYAIREFWDEEYGQLSPSKRQSETASLATRLNRFVRSPIVGNIIGQSSTTVDFRAAIENRQIIFIKLPVKTLKEDAQLIGTMLIAQIHAAIFSFADTPLERRPGFSLFVDEFQHFATTDFAEMFTEGRKFGSRVTVAHQYRNQLPDYLQSASQTARTKVCFQTTAEDSRELAHYYDGIIKPKVDRATLVGDPLEYLLDHGSDNPDTREFLDKVVRPYQQLAERTLTIEYGNAYDRQQAHNEQAAERDRRRKALEALSTLLFEAQAQGNPNIPLGTWQAPYHVPALDFFLEIYSRAKVYTHNIYDRTTEKEKGERVQLYIREMENYAYNHPKSIHIYLDGDGFTSAEALLQTRMSIANAYYEHQVQAYGAKRADPLPEYHLADLDKFLTPLYLFRCLMRELVAHPLGKIKPVATGDIAGLIVNLARRHAFVRSGSQVFEIVTLDTPPAVSKAEQEQRKATIQQQTRATYCRSADQVDEAISKRLGLTTSQPEQTSAEPEQQPDRPLYEEE